MLNSARLWYPTTTCTERPLKLAVRIKAYRVLKPGGRFLCLEFSKVNNELLNKLYKTYSKFIPKLGKFVIGKSEPYEYLINSIQNFYDQKEFLALIKKHSFQNISFRNLSNGITAIHSAWKV